MPPATRARSRPQPSRRLPDDYRGALCRARLRVFRRRPWRASGSRSTARTARCSRCARGARAAGAHVVTIGNRPDGTNINVGCGATDLSPALARPCGAASSTWASPSTATETACSPWTRAEGTGRRRDPCRRRPPPRRRPRGCHGDDEPRLPPADGGARDPRPDDACRRPLRRSRRFAGKAGSSAASSPATSCTSRGIRPETASSAPSCSAARCRESGRSLRSSPPRCRSCRRRRPTSRCVQRRFRRPSRTRSTASRLAGASWFARPEPSPSSGSSSRPKPRKPRKASVVGSRALVSRELG